MHNQHLEKLAFFGFKGLLMGFPQLLISLLAHVFLNSYLVHWDRASAGYCTIMEIPQLLQFHQC